MAVTKGLEWTFDTVASKYEKIRPGYVRELYEKLFSYAPIGPESNVVEVGSGAGQATGPVLQTGCRLTAVEYGKSFAALLREKFAEYPSFSVINGRFEETEFEPDSCDLVFSASAFHWIPEQAGYETAYAMLKKGGAFARFANHPHPDRRRPELTAAIQKQYDEYYYKYYTNKTRDLREYTEEMAKERAMLAGKYGFRDLQYAMFRRERTFTAKEYTELLGTYSDHIALDETVRSKFFAKVEQAITDHGGLITIYDTIDLQLARK